jgi:signal transduction histidine kinase
MPGGLERENAKLRKIVKVLIDRVERSTDAQGNAFSLFQAAITLESTVRQRTAELQALNRQLHREIEERRAVEAALERAKLEAEQSNRGKTEFLAAASHDLRQPLNVARLFIDALAERSHEAESAAMLEQVDQAFETAEALLATLLEMCRLDARGLVADIADAPIDPLLRRLSDEYARSAEECGLRFRVVPCDAIVRTDIRLLERILRNFLSNALRYTTQGGILVGCRPRGSTLRVEVWDTGPGIPHAARDEIFVEFRRLDTPQVGEGGMGLGLAIVNRIGRILGAPIGVRSRLGKGSVFSVDVPLGDAEHVARGDAGARRQRLTSLLVGKTALVLEESPAALRATATKLRTWGLYTLEAGTVSGAVAIVNAHGALPNVIIVGGHALEGTPLLDAIRILRERFDAAMPAVVVSAEADGERSEAGDGLWYLPVPLRFDRLRSLLHHVFAATAPTS